MPSGVHRVSSRACFWRGIQRRGRIDKKHWILHQKRLRDDIIDWLPAFTDVLNTFPFFNMYNSYPSHSLSLHSKMNQIFRVSGMNGFYHLSALRRIAYLLLSVGLTIYFATHFPFQNQEAWMIVASLFFGSYVLGATFGQFISILVLGGAFSAISVGFFSYLMMWPLGWAICFGVLSFILILFADHYSRYAVCCLTFNLLCLFTYQVVPLAPNAINLRVLYIFSALGLSIISAITLLPYFLQESVAFELKNYLLHLQKFNNEIFSCFLQSDYPDQLYLYERRLNLAKQKLNNILKYLTRLKHYIKNSQKKAELERQLLCLQNIYTVLIAVSALRWQVSDHNVFVICSDELKALQKNINALLTGSNDISVFENTILAFEANFQKVLQVTAREPVVFLFFISNLQFLAKHLADKKCDI